MEKEKQILIRKNSYWLSEVGYLFFKYQVGYEVYDYSKSASIVEAGVDLLVLNKQNIPTYVICYGNDYPYDKLFIPISENDKPSRLLQSIADFVVFYDINQNSLSLLDVPLLKEKLDKIDGDYKYVTKDNSVGIQISKDDELINKFINTYKLNKNIYEKCLKIYNYRIKNKKITESKYLPLAR